MHRHGYSGRKFHRETSQRRALLKGLADSLIIYESIETTKAKAQELVPYVEKLITTAKVGSLASRRRVIAKLHTLSSAHKLVDEIAPKLKARNSGYLRITKTGLRVGDRAQMVRVSFVDDLSATEITKTATKTPKPKQAATSKTTPKPKATTPRRKTS